MTIELKNNQIYINGEVCTNAEKIGYLMLDIAEVVKSDLTLTDSGLLFVNKKEVKC